MDKSIQPVYLKALPEDTDMVTGRFPAQRVRADNLDTVNIIVRSDDRTSGDDFDFQVDLLGSSNHIKQAQLAKCMLPLLPQINVHNHSITVTHVDGTVVIPLVDGFFSIQSLTNMLQSVFTAAWQSLDITNQVTVSYDVDRRSISIIDDNAEAFYIHSACIFNLYGGNVVKFPTEPSGSVPSTTSIESLSLGMIYSRYIILSSRRMTADQKSFSMISGKGASDVVAVVDIASQYSPSQFSVSSSFPGTDVVVDTLSYAPRINMNNRYKSLKVIDFSLFDEFSFSLSQLSTSSYRFEYPVSMWFQCTL